jgi:hypothetical protein
MLEIEHDPAMAFGVDVFGKIPGRFSPVDRGNWQTDYAVR